MGQRNLKKFDSRQEKGNGMRQKIFIFQDYSYYDNARRQVED